jgi:hypothetical protein
MNAHAETLSLSAFARRLGCRPSYVTKLKGDGRLVLDEAGRVVVAESLARIEATRGARLDVEQRHAQQRGELAAGGALGDADVSAPGERDNDAPARAGGGDVRLVDAKLRKESAQADQEEMKAAQMRGNLIPKDDVDAAMRFIGGAVRAALDVFPDQTAPLVAPVTSLEEAHELLTQACRDALNAIVEAVSRQVDELRKGVAK